MNAVGNVELKYIFRGQTRDWYILKWHLKRQSNGEGWPATSA